MKRSLLVAVVLLTAACGEPLGRGSPTDPSTATTTTTTTTPGPGEADRAAVLALALRQLVTVDNAFGGEVPFTELLVQAYLDPAAGTAMGGEDAGRALSEVERQAIEEALAPLAPVRWIADPADWRTEDLRPAVEGAVIVGVGEPVFDEAGVLVPVSFWCGGLCGTWLTYRLELRAGEWVLVGTEGPIAVS